MELSGFKRGKMLKQPSKPGRNRYRYSLDSQGRIIHRIEYTKSLGEPADQTWLHLDDFYLYHPEYVLRFVFGTASDESEGSEVGLTRIVWVDFSNGMPIKTFILEGDGLQYSEESYEYSGNQIVAVRLSWPEGPYQDRNFKILHEAETVRIVELINGPPKKELQIYPARD